MILKKKRREKNSIVGLKGNKIFVEQPNYWKVKQEEIRFLGAMQRGGKQEKKQLRKYVVILVIPSSYSAILNIFPVLEEFPTLWTSLG